MSLEYEGPADVLVLGAGVAGLAAARSLSEAALRVIVLEARDRVGGRIASVHTEGEAVELGAEFVHGRPPDLLHLIHEAGLELYERDGAQVSFEDGAPKASAGPTEEAFGLLETLKDFSGPDLSFAAYLDRRNASAEQRRAAIGFVEGFNAADHRVVSAGALGIQQKAEDEIEGDRLFRIRGGYDLLTRHLAQRVHAAGAVIHLNTPVSAVLWRPGSVEAIAGAQTFLARAAVITLPLGTLVRRDISIRPEPAAIFAAADGLRAGDVCRFTMRFRTRWWASLQPQPEMQRLSFLLTPEETPAVWWTAHPHRHASLTGWIGGPRSSALLGLDADELGRQGCATLERIFALDAGSLREDLIACHTHDWTADPFSRGAYSYVAVGGTEASRQMSSPVEQTLFFAGEHTDTSGHWGTVHGALRSGVRAARQILDTDRSTAR